MTGYSFIPKDTIWICFLPNRAIYRVVPSLMQESRLTLIKNTLVSFSGDMGSVLWQPIDLCNRTHVSRPRLEGRLGSALQPDWGATATLLVNDVHVKEKHACSAFGVVNEGLYQIACREYPARLHTLCVPVSLRPSRHFDWSEFAKPGVLQRNCSCCYPLLPDIHPISPLYLTIIFASHTVPDSCREGWNRHSVVGDSKYCLSFRGFLAKWRCPSC